MAVTSKPNTSTTTKATKATTKATSPKGGKAPATTGKGTPTSTTKGTTATPVVESTQPATVPANWCRTGGRGAGFVRYQRRTPNGHALSGYNTMQAGTAEQQALLADIAKACGVGVDDLGAYVVVDWSGGAMAYGCGSWADALVVVRGLGGHDTLAHTVHTGASKPMQGAVAMQGVAVRAKRNTDQDEAEAADTTQGAMADA